MLVVEYLYPYLQPMKNIHLVRHAESMWNAWFATDHPKTINITPFWQQQSQDLADKRDTNVDIIIHSTYDRTYQTAQPLIHKYPFATVIQNELIHEFTYLDTIKYKGTNMAQRAPYKELFRQQQDLWYKDSDTAESIIDLFTRVDQTILFLQSLLGQEVVMFTHGQFIQTLLEVLANPNLLKQPTAKKYLYEAFWDESKIVRNTQVFNITDILTR